MNIIDKLIKSFKEDLTPEDHNQLETWKNESEENLQAIKEFTQIHEATQLLKNREDFNKEAAWDKIEGQINLDEQVKSFSIHPALKGVAAIALLALSAFFLLRNDLNESSNVMYTATESIQSFSLSDDTEVMLDQSSQLEIIEDRYVALKGRASFDVTTTPDVANFTVKINNGRITVLGTQFSVLSTEDLLEVSVTEGHVKVDYDGRSIDLYANDVLKLFNKEVTVTSNTYENSDSWIKNELVFDNDPLSKVIHDVSTHFKKNIVFDKNINNAHNCPYTSKFTNPKLGDILKEIETIFNAEIIKQGNSYVIKSINC